MRTFLIFFSVAILIAFADAQKKPNITKPIVNLEKRPRQAAWHRPPEERRKLSLFPRNNMKFVVTPTSVRNEIEEQEGLPTKRPLMRKFVMREQNDKGTWSFAPRKPLMKTQRFTVTLAPPKSSNQKAIDEIESEESKKIATVIKQIEPNSSKTRNINKGNLVEMVTKRNDSKAFKNIHKIGKNITGEDISHKLKVNNSQHSQIVNINDNKTLPTFGQSLIDVRSLNDDGVILDDNKGINKEQNVRKTTDTLNAAVAKDFNESRVVDLNAIKYPIEQHENILLLMDSEKSKTGQILNPNDLEILFEKIVNNTERLNNSSVSDLKDDDDVVILKNETSVTLEDMPMIDLTKPNTFNDIISLSTTDDKQRTHLSDDFTTAHNIQKSLNTLNDKIHSISGTHVLNEEEFTEHVADTLIVINLEKFINLIDNDTVGIKDSNIFHDHRGIVSNNKQELKISQNEIAINTNSRPINNEKDVKNFTTDLERLKTQYSMGENKNITDDATLSLEIYESNMSLSREETSIECEEGHDSTSGNSNLTKKTSNEELIDNPNSSSLEEISITLISDTSNYNAEEHSNESFISQSDNLTNEEISNESPLNTAGEKLSNESYLDKSNDLTEEISNESFLESPNKYTGEQFSNESSNMAEEEISNESYYVDKSNNLTEEISSDALEQSGEAITDELSSSIAEDETSNESYLTDDISEESIDPVSALSGEQISNESSNISGGETSNESYLTDDISEESIDSVSALSGEQISNESSNIAGGEISNESYSHLIENASIENITETHSLSSDEDIIENVDLRMPDEPVISSHDRSVEKIAEEALTNRFKRSNNIVEEEELPTTVSGFKYTGHEVKLNHDLSYKNINA